MSQTALTVNNMSEKSIADLITEGTKNEVEKSGGTYKPTFSPDDEAKTDPSEAERQQLSDQLTAQIKEGTKEQKKYDKWYQNEYGTKNSHVSSSTEPY